MQFLELVNLSGSLLEELSRMSKGPVSPFTFDFGVVVPLYLVALKCRDSFIRRRKLASLLVWPRREGIWDSAFVGKMSSWVQSIEAEFQKAALSHHRQGFVRRTLRLICKCASAAFDT